MIYSVTKTLVLNRQLHFCGVVSRFMGPLARKGNKKQKITDYLDEIYGGTFTGSHLQKLVTRVESAKR